MGAQTAAYRRGRVFLPRKEKQQQRGQILALGRSGRGTYATRPAATEIEYHPPHLYRSYAPFLESTEIRRCRNTNRQSHQKPLCRSERKRAHGFPVSTEKLPSDTPQIVSAGTCRQGRVGPAARRSFDKFFNNSVRRFPFSANLLRQKKNFVRTTETAREDANVKCSDTFSRIASRSWSSSNSSLAFPSFFFSLRSVFRAVFAFFADFAAAFDVCAFDNFFFPMMIASPQD